MKILKEKMIAYETKYDEYSKTCKLTVYPLINVKVGKTWSLGYFDWLKLESEIHGSETGTIYIIESEVISKIDMIKLSNEQYKLYVFDKSMAVFTYDYENLNLNIIFIKGECEYEYLKFLSKELECDINNSVPRKGKIKKCKIDIIKSKINIEKDYSGNVYINILP